MIWLVLVACSGPGDTDDTGVPTDPIPTADTSPPEDPYMCDTPGPLPVEWTVLQGFGTAEDFDFDRNGNHVSIEGNNLVARDIDGNQTLLVPNVAGGTACTRRMPDGRFVVCDVGNNALVRADPISGEKVILASGLEYPNGAEVDQEGFIYVAEQSAGRVRRVNGETGESTLIATGLDNPNGVIFGPDYQVLYVGSFGSGGVYAIDRLGEDTWDEPRPITNVVGGFDGINVDICGNVYVTEFGPGRIGRITLGGEQGLAANLPSAWIPNMRWGNGIGGWDENTLYVSDRGQGRLFALEIGIPGKPDILPPVD